MTKDPKARPLGRRVFREEIREQLIEDILNGRLAPGSRIVETRIAQQFGVSQGPVREALRDLELFGFVVSLPFRGAQVREVSTQDLLEIYPIRAGLEGVAAGAAATRIDEATLTQLAELIDVMRDAANNDDHRTVVDTDRTFHHTIVKASGNRMLEHVWLTLQLSITTCVTHSVTHRSLHVIAERHVALLDALRTRDPERAEAAMRRHIEEAGEWIVSAHRKEQTAAQPASDERAVG
jgi:DNA-binding GntR family transcriptional regulator